jgi:hypothetical protein
MMLTNGSFIVTRIAQITHQTHAVNTPNPSRSQPSAGVEHLLAQFVKSMGGNDEFVVENPFVDFTSNTGTWSVYILHDHAVVASVDFRSPQRRGLVRTFPDHARVAKRII